MMNLLLDLAGAGLMREQRGTSVLDGPHWFNTYRCKDGRDITAGALEGKFYKQLLEKLGLAEDRRFAAQHAAGQWPLQRAALAELFATRTRDEWCELLEGSDACFAPVLSPWEAAQHPHLQARAKTAKLLLAVAVDTPFFPADFVTYAGPLIAGAPAVIAAYRGQSYPTNGLWKLSALRNLPDRIRSGTAPHSLKRLAEELGAVPLDYADLCPDDPFANANTPDDLAALEARARNATQA